MAQYDVPQQINVNARHTNRSSVCNVIQLHIFATYESVFR